MTFNKIEKDYWETFDINQGTDKINGYPVIKISDTYSRPATVEDFESFLKQSFIKYLQGEVERLEKSKKEEKDTFSTYCECDGECFAECSKSYNQAISDQITYYKTQIKELNENK